MHIATTLTDHKHCCQKNTWHCMPRSFFKQYAKHIDSLHTIAHTVEQTGSSVTIVV